MKNDTDLLFSVSIAIVATVATLAIGSTVTINASMTISFIGVQSANAQIPGITPSQHKCINFIVTIDALGFGLSAINPLGQSPQNNSELTDREVTAIENCVLHPEIMAVH